ncbi:MAG: hypothetical protein ACR2P1_05675 [Pseudomonadales bacterium]
MHFAFEFYEYITYNALVNPGNVIVKAVLSIMIAMEDYFFFAINPDHTVTTFRSQLETSDLAGLKTNQENFSRVTCLPAQYEKTVQAFRKNPDPPGQFLEWVCRDNMKYLDLKQHRLELSPKG